MDATPRHTVRDAAADPFGERIALLPSTSKSLLGGRFHFHSDSAALLELVEAAYAGLPVSSQAEAKEFRIDLRLSARPSPGDAEPPPVRTQAGAGLVCGVMDAHNYATIAPAQGRALIVAAEDMLARPYSLRYELIEFAVFTLAARGLGLVPLHGACVGRNGKGVLLLGASGMGKSTLALHGLLRGLDLLAEDAVFVRPESLLASGIPNYLHLKADALRFIDDPSVRHWIERSPIIRRRSGVEKFECDLRQSSTPPKVDALSLSGAVFVSNEPAGNSGALLRPLRQADIAARLAADQLYASAQPGWSRFVQGLSERGAHELRRGRHPHEGVDALLSLLA